jgi:LEA14-like dessication related protein
MHSVLAAVLATGCVKGTGLGALADALEAARPTVSLADLKLTALDFDGVEGDFVFSVDNPNPVGLDLSRFHYALSLNDQGFLEGTEDKGMTLAAGSGTQVVLPVALAFADLLEQLGVADGRDSVPYTLSGWFGVETPLGEVQVPYERSGELPVLRRPEIALSGLRLDSLDILTRQATLAVDLDVTNPGGALSLADFDYDLIFEGQNVAKGGIEEMTSLDAGSTRTVTLPFTLNLRETASAVVTAITGGSARLDLGVSASADVGTPFGEVPWEAARDTTLSLSQ